MFLKPRSKAIIHEFLEDEIILADLDAGIYFSLRESAIPLWQLLLSGYSLEETVALFQTHYYTDTAVELKPFVQLLLAEQLLIETAACEKTDTSHVFWPAMFKPPSLEKYEEMKNLLMLDPIHEVDEQGWPIRGGVV